MFYYTIIGGGIVGPSVGMSLSKKRPHKKILILEKEEQLACHQTGHNSGVIHSGIYYKPGSYKAKFARSGSFSMKEFCENYNIPHDNCGKVIVATDDKETKILEDLYQRGNQNNLNIKKIDKNQLQEIEPHVMGVASIKVYVTGIVDYKKVTSKFADIFRENNGRIICGEEVKNIDESFDSVTIETNKNTYHSKFLINCAGLQSDRIARMSGYLTDMKIIPFRGEYFKLIPSKRHLVRNLVYPVPNPEFPFLGVHFTRMIDGNVEAGPNAVLGFKREGYKKTDINIKDLAETFSYKGFYTLAKDYLKIGLEEMTRSF